MGEFWFELGYNVIGGLGVFLFGMKALSEGLQALASDFIRKVIGWLTTNRLMAVLIGAFVTTVIQSSSVTTVMVVGFVNAGLMTLTQAIGVIMGANIGTTITGWIVALKIGKYGLVFLALGLGPFFFTNRVAWKNSGKISMALGFIFLGLEFMSGGFKPLTKLEGFSEALTWFAADNIVSVIACVGIGCLLTCIVQSSSAMLAITIALATTGTADDPPMIGLSTAVALVLGENIGTTITAQLASIGGNVNAKRAAMAHTLFNSIGVTVIVLLFRPFMFLVHEVLGPSVGAISHLLPVKASDEALAALGFQIAAAHSLFNVTNVLLFLPFVPQLARLSERLRGDSGTRPKARLKLLGHVAQASPELALRQAEQEVAIAADVTIKMFGKVTEFVDNQDLDLKLLEEIDHAETVTDNIQKEVTLFLTTVLQMSVTHAQASRSYALIRIADEVESVADYCAALARYHSRLRQQNESLSPEARSQLIELLADTRALFVAIVERIESSDEKVASDDLLAWGEKHREDADAIRDAHLKRVSAGTCDALAGLIFSDMVVALRRIKNHSINMLDARNSSWESREHKLRVLDVPPGETIKPPRR